MAHCSETSVKESCDKEKSSMAQGWICDELMKGGYKMREKQKVDYLPKMFYSE